MEVDTEADAEAELVTVTVRVTVLPAEPVQAEPEAREDVKVVGEGASDEVMVVGEGVRNELKVVPGAEEEVVTVTSTAEEVAMGSSVAEEDLFHGKIRSRIELGCFKKYLRYLGSSHDIAGSQKQRGENRGEGLHRE